MAFAMNPDAQLMFFTKVFGSSAPTTEQVKQLIAKGFAFETAMYTVKATWPVASVWSGKSSSVSLTKGTTSLMKHSVEPVVEQQNKKLISDWVSSLYVKAGLVKVPLEPYQEPLTTTFNVEMVSDSGSITVAPEPVMTPGAVEPVTPQGPTTLKLLNTPDLPNLLALIKAVQTVTGLGLVEAKKKAEAVQLVPGGQTVLKTFPTVAEAQQAASVIKMAGAKVTLTTGVFQHSDDAPKVVPMAPPAAKPVNAVIDLKQATAVGQKVHGTSTGSVYHCVALTDHLKVAARLYAGGAVSIRAEWTDDPKDDLKKLQALGMSMKPNYASWHFDSAGVSPQQCIGAFLFATGIEWKQSVTTASQVVLTPSPY